LFKKKRHYGGKPVKELSLSSVLENFYSSKTSEMYTSIACRVVTVRVQLEDQRVDVQPLADKVLADGTSKSQPTILNVPLIFPASKKASMTFPIDVGDIVLCVFSQRSTDAFKASTGSETYIPQDKRRFSIRDAIAIPGLFPFKDAVNDPAKRKWTHSTRDMVITNNIGQSTECEFRLKDNGNIEMRTDQDFYAKFNDGLIECNNLTIEAQGNFTVNAGAEISMSSGTTTTMESDAATSIQAGTDLSLTAATWTVNVSGTTAVTCPITNWSGVFNLAGTLAMAPSAGGGGTATISAPLTVTEPITVQSGITLVGGDVVADGISLKAHSHSDPQGGTVGPPI
jgi:phage baseplate assembly protein gpV